jgi:hypothetical protein
MTYAENDLHAHYVTVRFNSRRWEFLAGPFRNCHQAERHVDDARRAAQAAADRTPRGIDFTFAEHGTSRLHFKPGVARTPGRFNDVLGLSLDPDTGYLSAD